MARPGSNSKLTPLLDYRDNASQGMILNSRAMVEKDDFVATGMISAVEGDFVAIEIGEFMHFELGDLVKITVYVPGGIRSFRSKIFAKDEGHLYIIHPPGLREDEKRESPRVEVDRSAALKAMISGAQYLPYQEPITISVKNISSSGLGFVLEGVHRLMPENVIELELEFGTVFSCNAIIVRREAVEESYFYGARFTQIPEERQMTLRAFILKQQVEAFSKKKQVPEPTKRRAFR